MIPNIDLPESKRVAPYGAVAIIGLSCIFPGAENMDAYWAAIKKCHDALSDIPEDHWSVSDYYDADPKAEDKTYGRRGGFLAPVAFEPLKYGIVPNDLAAIDSTQLLGLVGADRALNDSGYGSGGDYDHRRTAVFLGVTGALKILVSLGSRLAHPQLKRALTDSGVDPDTATEVLKRFANEFAPWQENSFPGLLGNVTAGRIANRLNLGGSNLVVDAACASSLAAIRQGIMELNQGRADLVVTGGVDTFCDPFMYTCFSKTPALSPSGDVRAYDQNGDGTMLGEGLGLVVLKRLEEARAHGDRIYAVIRAVGSSSDGKGAAIFAPTVQGQVRALEDAYEQVDFTPDTVELVEGHGTGTAVGDAVEVEALTKVFTATERGKTGQPWCALGSVKSQIGHTKAAAGAAGLIKAALALHYKTLPPTSKVSQPLAALTQPGTPFHLSSRPRPWLSKGPRRAGVSAFGFGGSNFHCLLEEFEIEKRVTEAPDIELFTFSASNSNKIVQKLKAAIQQKSPAMEACKSRNNFNYKDLCRLVLVVRAVHFQALGEEIITGFSRENASQWPWPEGVFYGEGPAVTEPRIFIWSGEERLRPDFLRDLATDWPELLEALSHEAALVADKYTGLTPLDLALYPPDLATAENKKKWEEDLAQPLLKEAAGRALNRGVELVLTRFGLHLPTSGRGIVVDPIKELDQNGGGPEALARLLGRLAVLGMPVDFKVWPQGPEISKELEGDKSEGTPFTVMLTGANYFVKKVIPPTIHRKSGAEPASLTAMMKKMAEDTARAHQDVMEQQALLLELTRKALALGGAEVNAGMVTASSTPITVAVEGSPAVMEASYTPRPANYGSVAAPLGFAAKPPATRPSLSEVKETVLNTLAAETGYPLEMLQLDMDLENDLGLDSIKKVEIMSILSDIFPEMPSLGAETMSAALTLGDLVALVDSASAETETETETETESRPPLEVAVEVTSTRPSVTSSHRQGSVTTVPESESEKAAEILLEVVSQETGYPRDMLNLGLSLEGDLGLDSIKKVEIMAALAEQLPEADFDAAEALSTLETLGDIVALVCGKEPRDEALVVAFSTPPLVSAVGTVSASNYGDILLEVVAAETGYPLEMLSFKASLEADLGLDSIKRVEIMAALSEKMGRDLPEEITTEVMNGAVTLGDLRDFLSGMTLPVSPEITPPKNTKNTKNTFTPPTATTTTELYGNQIAPPKKRKPGRPPKNQVPALPAVQVPPTVKPFLTTAITSFKVVPVPSETKMSQVGQVAWSLKQGPLRLIAEPGPLAEALEQSFRQAGVRDISRVGWDEEYDFSKLEGLILIWPEEQGKLNAVNLAFKLLKAAAPSLLAAVEKGNNPLVMGLTFMGGSFGLDADGSRPRPLDATAGGLAGLLKSVALEWTGVRVRTLDLPQNARLGTVCNSYIPGLIEAATATAPVESGLTGPGKRVTLELAPYKLKNMRVRHLREGQVLLVTGGARGVTAAVLKELARTVSPHLIILGRTSINSYEPGWLRNLNGEAVIRQALFERAKVKPELFALARESERIMACREIRTNLLAMEKAGAKVTYLSGDFLNPEILEEALSGIKQKYGDIHGFIHGAGVLADGLLATKREGDFQLVLDTKVRLAEMILGRLSGEPLNLVVFFSSSTARFGRRSQSDYAAGNEILNKLALSYSNGREGPKCLSVNWGPWDGGMVGQSLKRMFEEEGVGLIPLGDGARLFTGLIGTPKSDPVEVVVLGPDMEIPVLQ